MNKFFSRVLSLAARPIVLAAVCLPNAVGICYAEASDGRPELTQEQKLYLTTVSLYKKGKISEARQASDGLVNYALAPYIDYYDLYYASSPDRVPEVKRFAKQFGNDSLVADLEARYVREMSRIGRYDLAASIRAKPFRVLGLNCVVQTAKYKSGGKKGALEFIKAQYMKHASLPAECSYLMGELKSSGGLKPADTYVKLVNKFRQRRVDREIESLAADLKNTPYEANAAVVAKLYKNPSQVLELLPVKAIDAKRIAIGAILLTARKSSETAFNLLKPVSIKYGLSKEQIEECSSYIARHMMIHKNSAHMKWLDDTLISLKNPDDLIQNRAKLAIWFKNWKDLEKWVSRLPKKEAADTKWIYWKAYALEQQGHKEEARKLYLKVLNDRSFYSFMAASKIYAPWPFVEQRVHLSPLDEKKALSQWIEFRRVEELLAVGDTRNAGREWVAFIGRLKNKEEVAKAGVLAYNKGWFDYSLKACIIGKAWNLLQLRFPMPMPEYYAMMSKKTGVSKSFLYAISRQESAMNPAARSPVGARGMMQLMPDTAAMVAKKNNIPYKGVDSLFDPKVNVELGARYLQSLLEAYDGNRVLAATGYKAGPHRVEAWRSKDMEGQPVDVWVENIPFNETRNYVQQVIVFDAIYQKFMKKDPYFLTEKEFKHRY